MSSNNTDTLLSVQMDDSDSILISPIQGYQITPCRQDQEGLGYFEVFASATGTGIGFTNMIVIVLIICGGRRLHKATFYCIGNLAVADMLAGLLLLWIFCLQKVLLPFRTPLSEMIQKSIWTVTIWSSMLSQLVIAIDRYCYVTKVGSGGSSYAGCRNSARWGNQKRKKLIKIGISLTWFVPIVTFVIPVFSTWNCLSGCFCQVPVNSTSGVFYMVCNPMEKCSQINPPFTKSSMLYLGLVLIIMPIIPCVLYAKIYHFVRMSTLKLKSVYNTRHNANNTYVNSTEHDSRAPYSENFEIKRDNKNVTKDPSLCSKTAHCPPCLEKNIITDLVREKSHSLHPKKDLQSASWKKRISNVKWFKNNGKIEINGNCCDKKIDISKSACNASISKSVRSNFWRNNSKRDMKLLRTLVIILVLFLVSTIPLGLIFLVSFGETDKRYVLTAKILITASLLNSMVNPWIYFWRFSEMRSAIRRVFCKPFFAPVNSFRERYFEDTFSNRRDHTKAQSNTDGAEELGAKKTSRNIPRPKGSKEVTSSSNSAL